MNCRHCGDLLKIPRPVCKHCGVELADECMDCHDEVKHDIIRDQNMHFAGNPVSLKVNGPDYDQDAYGYVEFD